MYLNGGNFVAQSIRSVILPAYFLLATFFLQSCPVPLLRRLQLRPVVALFRLVVLPLVAGYLVRRVPKPLRRLLRSLPGPNPFSLHISIVRVPRFIRMRLDRLSKTNIGINVSNRVIAALTVAYSITRVLRFLMTALDAFIARALIGLVFLVPLLLPLVLSLRGRPLVRRLLQLQCRSLVAPLGLLLTWRRCCRLLI